MQHYLRTTRWVVSDAVTLAVGSNCRLRQWTGPDALNLREQIRKRNVFSRHGGPRDFYFQRAAALEGATVVEMYSGGSSNTEALAEQALLTECVVAASFVLGGARSGFLRRAVGVTDAYLDLHVVKRGAGLAASSTSRSNRQAVGLKVDSTIAARYKRLGFPEVFNCGTADTELGSRLRAALNWLLQSRTDADPYSAFVKTATALESLLVIGREPPTRALSERGAFLLSDDPGERRAISLATLRFYEIRSDIVHGKRVPDRAVSTSLRQPDSEFTVATPST